MLLRNLVNNLREQNWTAVTIELLILVIGVFIGIQVSNWNDARKDIEREQIALERIHQDLVKDVDELNLRTEYWRGVAAFGRAALREDEAAQAPESDWMILVSYHNASQINPFNTNATAFDELNNAGEFTLIRDSELRKEIAVYYQGIRRRARDLYDFQPEYRATLRGVMPLRVQAHIWSNCYVPGRGLDGFLECPPSVDADTAAEIVASLEQTPGLQNQLRFWVTNLEIAADFASDEIVRAQQLLDRLARH